MRPNNPLPSSSETSSSNKVIAVVGPTGSGKTSLGVALANKVGGVIISADSRQVYKGLDIGTNKEGISARWHGEPSRVVNGVYQLLIDVVNPGERFTLHDWLLEARRFVAKVHSEGSVPIVVGGTGLYVSALLDGYQPGSGRFAQGKNDPGFTSLVVMNDVSREELYQRSDQRFVRIFDSLVEEVGSLVGAGVSHSWLQQLGLDYRFASYFLTRQMNREIAISQFQQASRQYIRRQLTWWRHHNTPRLIKDKDEAIKLVQEFATGAESDTV